MPFADEETPMRDGFSGTNGQPAVRPFAVNSEDAPLEGAGDTQSGHLTWRTLFSGDRTPTDQITLGVAEFPPRGMLNRHRHEPAEFYFGLSGEGTRRAFDQVIYEFMDGTPPRSLTAAGDTSAKE